MHNLKKLVWALLIVPVIGFAQVSEYQLENGLKLLVKPDNRAPVVVSQVWYKVGSSYEHNGITGISHILEHMMFKGTENLGPNEFSQIIAENGGSQNAFTGRDYTAYFQTLEKERLEISFRLEAERMRKLIIDDAELLKEREVVAEERRMRTDDNPRSLLREAMNAMAFMNSPYHHPVIGWMNDINHYDPEDLREWYQMWYAPNNATVVVVGDVEPDEVYQLAQKFFGPLAPEQLATVKPQVEVPQRGLRTLQLKAPAELPYLMMGWKVPVVTTAVEEWESYALDVLAGILDGGASSRFARELVRGQQVVAGVSAYNSAFSRLDDIFTIAATPAQGKTVEDVKQAVLAQLDKVKFEPVTEAELQRVKTQVIASSVYQLDSVFYQAMQLGMLETVGLDWRLVDSYSDKISAITAEQVQQVAEKYFIEDGLTIAELIPVATDNATPRPTSGDPHAR